MKKFMSLLLTFTMLFSLAAPAYAADTKSKDVTANYTPTYTVTIDESITNGSVTADKARAAEGDTVALTVAPDSGYEMDTLTVSDGTSTIDHTAGEAANTYTFTMPASAVTVSATFKSTSGGGSGSGGEETTEITITDIIVSEYDGNGAVTVDEANQTYIVTIPAGETSVQATFTVKGTNLNNSLITDKATRWNYKIGFGSSSTALYGCTYDEATGNRVTDDKLQYAQDATALRYTLTGAADTASDGWTETGWKIKVVQAYTITNSTTDSNGTITVPASAGAGTEVTPIITANEGYELDTLTVTDADGVDVTVT